MSSLVVQVRAIEQVKPHGNADMLEIAVIGGWQCVVPKGRYRDGDLVVYVPPDTVLPQSLTDRLGVTKYCQDASRARDGSSLRVRCARLRGEPSFGLVLDIRELPLRLDYYRAGEDVAAALGATKWDPPGPPASAGDAMAEHPLFPRYTDIENLRHYPTIFAAGEHVTVTEKIHGTNCRAGVVEGVRMAGSHKVRRAEPAIYALNTYWFPWSVAPVEVMLSALSAKHRQVVLYGEVFGRGVQAFDYGQRGKAFAAFDLLIDGQYCDVARLWDTCDEFGVAYVPLLRRMAWSKDSLSEVIQQASGPAFAGAHQREGIVVRAETETRNSTIGRLVLKYVSDAHLLARQQERFPH